MAHGEEPNVYDYLATSKVSEVTVTQLEQALENSFINKSNIEFWKGPITVHRLLEVGRTYPLGAAIPEQSGITQIDLDPAGATVFQPPGSELWEVVGIFGTGVGASATIKISWYDGTTQCPMFASSVVTTAGTIILGPDDANKIHPLTNTLYLSIEEIGSPPSAGAEILIAFHRVSL